MNIFAAIADPLFRMSAADGLAHRIFDVLHEHASGLRAPRACPSTLLRTVSLSNRLTPRLGEFGTNRHE